MHAVSPASVSMRAPPTTLVSCTRNNHQDRSAKMQPPYPCPTRRWHDDTYDAISPLRPELSAAGKTVIITGAVSCRHCFPGQTKPLIAPCFGREESSGGRRHWPSPRPVPDASLSLAAPRPHCKKRRRCCRACPRSMSRTSAVRRTWRVWQQPLEPGTCSS